MERNIATRIYVLNAYSLHSLSYRGIFSRNVRGKLERIYGGRGRQNHALSERRRYLERSAALSRCLLIGIGATRHISGILHNARYVFRAEGFIDEQRLFAVIYYGRNAYRNISIKLSAVGRRAYEICRIDRACIYRKVFACAGNLDRSQFNHIAFRRKNN